MNTEENNKMISEFMDYTHVLLPVSVGLEYYDGDEMEHHSSWDWLMPVVNKIEDYLSDNVGKLGYFDECLSSNDLEVRYQAVVEFINEYNKNK